MNYFVIYFIIIHASIAAVPIDRKNRNENTVVENTHQPAHETEKTLNSNNTAGDKPALIRKENEKRSLGGFITETYGIGDNIMTFYGLNDEILKQTSPAIVGKIPTYGPLIKYPLKPFPSTKRPLFYDVSTHSKFPESSSPYFPSTYGTIYYPETYNKSASNFSSYTNYSAYDSSDAKPDMYNISTETGRYETSTYYTYTEPLLYEKTAYETGVYDTSTLPYLKYDSSTYNLFGHDFLTYDTSSPYLMSTYNVSDTNDTSIDKSVYTTEFYTSTYGITNGNSIYKTFPYDVSTYGPPIIDILTGATGYHIPTDKKIVYDTSPHGNTYFDTLSYATVTPNLLTDSTYDISFNNVTMYNASDINSTDAYSPTFYASTYIPPTYGATTYISPTYGYPVHVSTHSPIYGKSTIDLFHDVTAYGKLTDSSTYGISTYDTTYDTISYNISTNGSVYDNRTSYTGNSNDISPYITSLYDTSSHLPFTYENSYAPSIYGVTTYVPPVYETPSYVPAISETPLYITPIYDTPLYETSTETLTYDDVSLYNTSTSNNKSTNTLKPDVVTAYSETTYDAYNPSTYSYTKPNIFLIIKRLIKSILTRYYDKNYRPIQYHYVNRQRRTAGKLIGLIRRTDKLLQKTQKRSERIR